MKISKYGGMKSRGATLQCSGFQLASIIQTSNTRSSMKEASSSVQTALAINTLGYIAVYTAESVF